MSHDDETEQPGLFADPYSSPPDQRGPIEDAAGQTIDALREAGALDRTHSLKVALIIEGARTLDRELRTRQKVSVAAIALFSRVTEIADGLPTIQQAVDSAFDRITRDLQLDEDDDAAAPAADAEHQQP